jgi:hypothetical protein
MGTFIELIARTIDEALKGPVCKKHLALAEKIDYTDVILSYNYDLLADNALCSRGKLSDEGYRRSFYRVNDDGNWGRPETMIKLFPC